MAFAMLDPDAANNRTFEFLNFTGIDKVVHFGLFFGWSFLHFEEAVFVRRFADPSAKKFWYVATNSLVLGLLIEIAQNYIPNRTSDLYDLLANVAGSVTALLAVKLVRRWKSDLN